MAETVNVRFFGTLRYFGAAVAGPHPVAPGTTVGELLADLNIPPDRVFLALVNGEQAAGGSVIRDGDRIELFPPLGGG